MSDENQVAAKIIQSPGRKLEFDEEEFDALRAMASYWLAAQAVGRAAKAIKAIFMWIGWGIVFWFAAKNGLVDWIKGVVK